MAILFRKNQKWRSISFSIFTQKGDIDGKVKKYIKKNKKELKIPKNKNIDIIDLQVKHSNFSGNYQIILNFALVNKN